MLDDTSIHGVCVREVVAQLIKLNDVLLLIPENRGVVISCKVSAECYLVV